MYLSGIFLEEPRKSQLTLMNYSKESAQKPIGYSKGSEPEKPWSIGIDTDQDVAARDTVINAADGIGLLKFEI